MILELEARGGSFVRFNTEDYPSRVHLAWSTNDCRLSFGGRWLSLADVVAVWYRRPVAPELDADLGDQRARWIAGESLEAVRGVWRTYDGLWVNHPDLTELASSKPEQLRRARRMGFDIPETLVTNNPDEVQEFANASPRSLICKPLRSGYVEFDNEERLFFTSSVTQADLAAFKDFSPELYLFQHHVHKAYEIRVTVIGERVFAVRLDSQVHDETSVDWRRGDQTQLRHTPLEMPDEIGELCLRLVHSYGLAFRAIDLAVDEDGHHIFFEINPNGQWAWIEQRTGLPMRAALADLLATGVAG